MRQLEISGSIGSLAEETYLTVGGKGSEPYQKFICQLEEQSKKNEKMLTPEGNTVNVEGRSMNLPQALTAIQANLNTMERELKAYAEKTFAKLFEPEEPDKGLRAHLKDSKYDPYINPESGKNDTPALYIWLHQIGSVAEGVLF